MRSKQISNLIIRSDELSFNDFCQEAVKNLGVFPLGEVIKQKLTVASEAGNSSLAEFLKLLLSLSNQGILPDLRGDLSLLDMLNKADSYSRDEFIDTHDYSDDEPGTFELWCFNDREEKTQSQFNVDLNEVHIISPFQGDKIVISSPCAPGCFYALDHEDGYPYILASNVESFIKALINLSMIKSDEIFNDVFEYYEANDKRLSSTGLGAMRRIIDELDGPIESMNLSCVSKNRYEKLRQLSINQKTPNVDVSEDRLIKMLDSIYGKPNNT